MRKKGREVIDYINEADEHAVNDKKWYEKIEYSKVDPVIAKRPRGGGARINFFSEGQMPDLALEIKEGSNGRFKNSNDVHRAAHYIGMYMLREMKLGNNLTPMQKMYKKLERLNWEVMKKDEIIELFNVHFERFCLGKITKHKLNHATDTILNGIVEPEIKEWAISHIQKIMAAGGVEQMLLNRLKVVKHRKKAENMNLEVIDNKNSLSIPESSNE